MAGAEVGQKESYLLNYFDMLQNRKYTFFLNSYSKFLAKLVLQNLATNQNGKSIQDIGVTWQKLFSEGIYQNLENKLNYALS